MEKLLSEISVPKYCEIRINNQGLYSLLYAIKFIIELNIPNPSDAAFLMETMSHFAEQQVEDDTQEYSLVMNDKQLLGSWHCCKILIDNGLGRKEHYANVMMAMSKMAIEIDRLVALEKKGPESQEQSIEQCSLAPYDHPTHGHESSNMTPLIDLDDAPKASQPLSTLISYDQN